MDAKNAQSPKVDRGFAPEALSVFGNVFDFYGTLGHNGRVKQLAGRIFGSTNTNPQLLIGQVFSETVFWQSSEVTAKLIEKAIAAAASGDSTDVIIDFRISSDEKIAMEIFVQPLPSSGSDAEIFIAGQAISKDRSQLNAASEQLLFAAENALIGLWFWDFDEDRIHSTPRCNELFGLPPYETFQYEDYREAIHPDDRDFVDSFLTTSRVHGSKYEEEFRVISPD
ncbi:MAG: PAS domain-containing protein, partial [Acidobacteria bacterium]|nr:PAS domain-containing protein [Acidobacteriota bacterium]